MRRAARCLLLCIAPTLLALIALAVPAGAAQIYWSDGLSIQRAELDGSNVTTLVPNALVSFGLAVDTAGGHLYWAEAEIPGPGSIQRSDLDGNSIATVVSSPFPIAVRVDPAAGRLWWSDTDLNQIRYSNLDGTGIGTLIGGVEEGIEIELDRTGQMYPDGCGLISWSDSQGGNEGVWVSGLASPNPNIDCIFSHTPTRLFEGRAFGLAIDPAHDRLYWSTGAEYLGGPYGIWGATLGGPAELLVEGTPAFGLDFFDGRLYWTGANSIYSANPDGSDVVQVVSGLSGPWGLDVVPEPTTAVLLAGGLLALGLRRRA